MDKKEVTSEDLDQAFETIMKDFPEIFTNEIKEFAADIMYEGFNPAYAAAFILKREPTGLEIAKMIAISVERGNNITKMIKKMSVKGREEVNNLKVKFSILPKAKSNTDITLARIAIAFPMFTVRYAQKFAENLTITPEMVKSKFGFALPRGMCVPAFGNIVPRDSKYDSLFVVYCAVQQMFSEIVARDIKNSTMEKTVIYARIARRNKYVPDTVRRNVLKEIGATHGENGNVVKNLVNLAEAIKKHYGEFDFFQEVEPEEEKE